MKMFPESEAAIEWEMNVACIKDDMQLSSWINILKALPELMSSIIVTSNPSAVGLNYAGPGHRNRSTCENFHFLTNNAMT